MLEQKSFLLPQPLHNSSISASDAHSLSHHQSCSPIKSNHFHFLCSLCSEHPTNFLVPPPFLITSINLLPYSIRRFSSPISSLPSSLSQSGCPPLFSFFVFRPTLFLDPYVPKTNFSFYIQNKYHSKTSPNLSPKEPQQRNNQHNEKRKATNS